MIRVLIVDDSVFVRRSLATIFESSSDIVVAGFAVNGEDALVKIKELDPDIVTLDIEMPKMDGISALKHIMADNPLPVLMVSSLTQEGAESTLRALELGALDYIGKQTSAKLDLTVFSEEVITKVRALSKRKAIMRLIHRNKKEKIAQANASAPRPVARTEAVTSKTDPKTLWSKTAASSSTVSAAPVAAVSFDSNRIFKINFDALCIGVSTGGPPAVQKLLSGLPKNFPVPILIAQHMPAAFTSLFARRLDSQCEINVKEAEAIERLRPGTVYICPGGKHLRLENRCSVLTGVVTEEPVSAIYKPSASLLMESAGQSLGRRALGIMLTGMGSDGLEGAIVIKAKGGVMLAQSEASCVVYGMPKAIVDANLADEVVDIDAMASAVLRRFL